jgi:hypothetical protein
MSHVTDSRLDSPRSGWVASELGSQLKQEDRTMTWETPGFVEVRMDAEMTAYADDLAGS